jgi:PDZ domain
LREALVTTIAGSLICLLTGCGLRGPQPPQLENKPPEITTDEFSKFIAILGPSRTIEVGSGYTASYNLFTNVDKKTHRYSHGIGVDVVYNYLDQIGYRYAADDTTQALRLVQIERTRSRICKYCLQEEVFDINVSDSSLRAHAPGGYRVKAFSVTGDYLIIEITPPMIAAQYAALEKVIGREAASAPSPPAQPPGSAKTETAAKPSSPPGLAANPGIGLQMLPQSTGAMTHGNMHGAVILAVIPGSPAEAAGVRGGDLIVKFDGKPVDSGNDILELLAKAKPHSVVTVDILRGPTHVTVHLKL